MDFREIITDKVAGDYLKAEWGTWLSVSKEGSVYFGDGAIEIDPEERAVARVKCPGVGNLDSSDFWCEDNGGMDIANMIDDCVDNGDMSEYIDDIIDALENYSG